MTDSTSAQPVAEEIEGVAESLESQQQEVEKFESFLDEAGTRISSLDPNKRQAFYESVEDLRSEITGVETVTDLLDLREGIEEAIKSPLKEAALDAFDEFVAEAGVEFDQEDETDLRDSIRNSVQSELEDMAEMYQALSSQIADYPPRLKRIIAHRIEAHPSSIINDRSKLSADIEKLYERHENLEVLQPKLQQVSSWAPSGDLTEQDKFYEDLDYSLSTDSIQDNISVTDARVEDLEDAGLSIADPVQNRFEEDLENEGVTGLSRVVKDLRDDVNSLSRVFEEVQTYATALNSFGRDRGMFDPAIDELLAETEQLRINKYQSVSAVRDEIAQLQSEYEEFLDSVSDRLRAQREMVEELSTEFENREPPSVPEKISSEKSLFNSFIRENTLDALEACVTYDSWVENTIDDIEIEGDFETERAIEIWGILYEGDPVPLTEKNQDEILALANRFTLSVVLGSE
jgi:hypothetical protein